MGAPGYAGPFTLPLLWDRQNSRIINNDTLDIMQMLNNNFNQYTKHKQLNLLPSSKKTQIMSVIEGQIFETVSTGPYKVGYAKT